MGAGADTFYDGFVGFEEIFCPQKCPVEFGALGS